MSLFPRRCRLCGKWRFIRSFFDACKSCTDAIIDEMVRKSEPPPRRVKEVKDK